MSNVTGTNFETFNFKLFFLLRKLSADTDDTLRKIINSKLGSPVESELWHHVDTWDSIQRDAALIVPNFLDNTIREDNALVGRKR